MIALSNYMKNNRNNNNIWNIIKMKDDDIVIASTVKSGTTWLQQIIAQLVFKGEFNNNLNETSIWVDTLLERSESEIINILQNQNHRRFMKTHSPAEVVLANNNKHNGKYLFITRDFRDVIWSFQNHFSNSSYPLKKDSKDYELNKKLRETENGYEFWKIIVEYRHLFKHHSHYKLIWSYFNTIKSWLQVKNENVLILHFNDLKKDLKGNIVKISRFLGLDYDNELIDKIHEKCTFQWMKQHSHRCAPMHFNGNSKSFINKGVNKRWIHALSQNDLNMYKEIIHSFFDEQTINWIENGSNITSTNEIAQSV
jgi:aryl sulfotransferase